MTGSARTVLFALTWASCATLAGCGGGNGGDDTPDRVRTLPAAEYAKRADALCREIGAKVIELRTGERLRDIQTSKLSQRAKFKRSAAVLRPQLTAVTAFRRKFEALGMPSEHRDDAERLLAKARSAEEELDRAITALQAGDEAVAVDALQRYAGFSQQSASIARDSELNFAACGAGA